jgi:serine/threonine protein kinase
MPPELAYSARLVGEGGLGKLHIATFRGEEYAIKVGPRAVLEAEYEIQRAVYESGAMGVPYVIDLLFVDGTEDAALIMEYVPGVSAGGQSLPARVAAALFVEAVRKVRSAHRAGFLHVDIKPANIMLSRRGCVWVVDWGCARRVSDRGPARNATPGYASPEVADGQAPTDRDDLWALGATGWELVNGGKGLPRRTSDGGLHPDEVLRLHHLLGADAAPACVRAFEICLGFEREDRDPELLEHALSAMTAALGSGALAAWAHDNVKTVEGSPSQDLWLFPDATATAVTEVFPREPIPDDLEPPIFIVDAVPEALSALLQQEPPTRPSRPSPSMPEPSVIADPPPAPLRAPTPAGGNRQAALRAVPAIVVLLLVVLASSIFAPRATPAADVVTSAAPPSATPNPIASPAEFARPGPAAVAKPEPAPLKVAPPPAPEVPPTPKAKKRKKAEEPHVTALQPSGKSTRSPDEAAKSCAELGRRLPAFGEVSWSESPVRRWMRTEDGPRPVDHGNTIKEVAHAPVWCL